MEMIGNRFIPLGMIPILMLLSPALSSTTWIPGMRIVPFQHVGIYLRRGQLLDTLLQPGMAFYLPFFTQAHDIFVGIDHDIVPPSQNPPIDCRAHDGSVFLMRLDVSNRLNVSQVLETLHTFGLNYDQTTIYDQVAGAVKDVCSKLSSHDIAIEMYDRIDDLIAAKLRERQATLLHSKVEIVQVKIIDLRIPDDLNVQFARQASERARRKALIEERDASKEEIENKRLKHAADMFQLETAQRNEALLQTIKAEAAYNTSRLDADAMLYKKQQEAIGDKAWLSAERLKFEEITSDPLTVLIRKVKRVVWS